MSTLLRITPTGSDGWALVVIEWTHAESLQKHIRSLQLKTSPIRDHTVPSVRVEKDEKGGSIIVKETMDQAFEVQTSPKALIPILREWLKSFD